MSPSSILPTPSLDHSTSPGGQHVHSSPPAVLLPPGKPPCDRGQHVPQHGVDSLVSMPSNASLPSSVRGRHEVEAGVDEEEGDLEWDWAKLLPNGLFSADPGLLTVEFTSLSKEVCQVLK